MTEPLKLPCEFVVPEGIYCGKAFDVHCMGIERCTVTGSCQWRKFHGLDVPGFNHLYRRKWPKDPTTVAETFDNEE